MHDSFGLRDFARQRKNQISTVSSCAKERTRRLTCLSLVLFGWVAVVLVRLGFLQLGRADQWAETALKQHLALVTVSSERGLVLDRAGRALALSVPAVSIYVRPKLIKDLSKVTKELRARLPSEIEDLEGRLKSQKPFVWIARQIPRHIGEEIEALGLSGVGIITEAKRYYPYQQHGSSLIGRVGTDGTGQSGIERALEARLHEASVKTAGVRDAFGNIVQLEPAALEVPRGESVQLTVDARLQVILDEELEQARLDAQAVKTVGLLVDADTGDVLALGQSPAVNFNAGRLKSEDDLKNFALEMVVEPGSILKPVVVAAAIEAGTVSAAEKIDCRGGRIIVSGHSIEDVHPAGILSVHEVIVHSSNVGMSKIGLKMGSEKLVQSLKGFGFGSFALGGVAGESVGMLALAENASALDVAAHAFGQGIGVTPAQMVRATAALVNGGKLPTLRVLAGSEIRAKRVISEQTSKELKSMLIDVVESPAGTGKKARLGDIIIGGKTGTAQKAIAGKGYVAGKYVSSFVGFADATSLGLRKNLVAIVMVDEPGGKNYYGGSVAAPAFAKVMERSVEVLLSDGVEGPSPKLNAPSILPASHLVRPASLTRPLPVARVAGARELVARDSL